MLECNGYFKQHFQLALQVPWANMLCADPPMYYDFAWCASSFEAGIGMCPSLETSASMQLSPKQPWRALMSMLPVLALPYTRCWQHCPPTGQVLKATASLVSWQKLALVMLARWLLKVAFVTQKIGCSLPSCWLQARTIMLKLPTVMVLPCWCRGSEPRS